MSKHLHQRELNVDSAAWKLREYFEANPDEELSVEDASTKFGVSVHAVYNAIERLEFIELVPRVIRCKRVTA